MAARAAWLIIRLPAARRGARAVGAARACRGGVRRAARAFAARARRAYGACALACRRQWHQRPSCACCHREHPQRQQGEAARIGAPCLRLRPRPHFAICRAAWTAVPSMHRRHKNAYSPSACHDPRLLRWHGTRVPSTSNSLRVTPPRPHPYTHTTMPRRRRRLRRRRRRRRRQQSRPSPNPNPTSGVARVPSTSESLNPTLFPPDVVQAVEKAAAEKAAAEQA